MDRLELLKTALKGIDLIPESELKFISKDAQKGSVDCALYARCVEKGDMSVWENLKKMRGHV